MLPEHPSLSQLDPIHLKLTILGRTPSITSKFWVVQFQNSLHCAATAHSVRCCPAQPPCAIDNSILLHCAKQKKNSHLEQQPGCAWWWSNSAPPGRPLCCGRIVETSSWHSRVWSVFQLIIWHVMELYTLLWVFFFKGMLRNLFQSPAFGFLS